MQKYYTPDEYREFISYVKKLDCDDSELAIYLNFVIEDHLLGISVLNTAITLRLDKLLKKLLNADVSTDSEYLLSQTILNRNYSSIAALVHYGAHTYPGALLKCVSAISVVSSFMPYGHTRLMLNMIESLVDETISSKCLEEFTEILTSDVYINPVMTTEHTFTFDLFISLI